MSKASLVFLCALCAFGQAAPPVAATSAIEKVPSEKAPPAVDAALRARINQFYQAHVDAKYRLADQVVADDSKDIFFAAAKTKYDGYDIVKVDYWDDFTKASAVVATKGTWFLRGNKMPVTMPVTSTWKVVDGQWYWYVSAAPAQVPTPFGSMNYNSGVDSQGAVAAIPGDPKVMAEKILASVKVDKQDLMLSSYEHSAGEVRIHNGMSGPITVQADLDGGFPGLSMKLDRKTVPAGGDAVLSFVCDPKDRVAKPTLTARVAVEPTNQVIPIKLTFAIPPELEKLIPKDARPRPIEP